MKTVQPGQSGFSLFEALIAVLVIGLGLLLAYMPSKALLNARHLTYPTYTHRYYIDGAPVENDVFFDDKWHTVLVGGLGAGGQGLYALNISNPGGNVPGATDPAFNESNAAELVLWEFTDQDDADLGYMVGQPAVVRLHNSEWGWSSATAITAPRPMARKAPTGTPNCSSSTPKPAPF